MRNMKRIDFYIDYDEDPDIGGQQGIFQLNHGHSGHSHFLTELIGAKIIEIKNGKDGRMIVTVEKP